MHYRTEDIKRTGLQKLGRYEMVSVFSAVDPKESRKFSELLRNIYLLKTRYRNLSPLSRSSHRHRRLRWTW